MNFSKKQLIVSIVVIAIIIIAILLFTIPSLLWGCCGSHSNPGDWGNFGDYFGGLLSPIIGYLSLAVTVWIAFAISEIDDKRNEKSREFDERRHELAIEFERKKWDIEIKEEEFRRICTELYKIMSSPSTLANKDTTWVVFTQINIFRKFSGKRFDRITKDPVTENLSKSLDSIYDFLATVKKNDKFGKKIEELYNQCIMQDIPRFISRFREIIDEENEGLSDFMSHDVQKNASKKL